MLAGNTIWPKLAFKECQSMRKLVSSLASLLGGNLGNGNGRFSDKVIKFRRRGPDACD
jgi:hypothetical protein